MMRTKEAPAPPRQTRLEILHAYAHVLVNTARYMGADEQQHPYLLEP